jgi:hypothetical protein
LVASGAVSDFLTVSDFLAVLGVLAVLAVLGFGVIVLVALRGIDVVRDVFAY